MNNIWYSEIFCGQILFGIGKFFMNEDIRSSVFGNISLAKIFSLRYSEIFYERRSSVFGIRNFFKNEDLRSSVFGNFS